MRRRVAIGSEGALRGRALALALALGLIAPGARAEAPPIGGMALGNPKAPVRVIEYASVGCPHCADWARDVFPAFKAKYIDTGKARFVFREMLTGDAGLAAAGFLTAHCAGPGRYFQVVDAVFANQQAISADGGGEVLYGIAKSAGLSREALGACLQDKAAVAALNDRTERDAQLHHVHGTPTFFIGGHELAAELTLPQIDAAIARARREARQASSRRHR